MDRQGIITQLTEPHPFGDVINLAHPRLGAQAIFATDEFYGDKARLISPEPPVFLPDKYDANGKWMDGWESRRRRTPGHDWCVIRLGMPGRIAGIEIDTRHFTGNYPPHASVEACYFSGEVPDDSVTWHEIVAKRTVNGNRQHFSEVQSDTPWTHIRLHIYPDGGVARLRVWGRVERDFSSIQANTELDLFAIENGGRAMYCNDEHFGTMHNLNAPGRGINMGDGWETARRRAPGNDWVVLALGHPGKIRRVVVDTAHFKGNYPDEVELRATQIAETAHPFDPLASAEWPILMPRQKLKPDTIHEFIDVISDSQTVTHIRMNIFPDGGVSRLRIYGVLAG
ncbi:MAG: allantoicase [Pseudomonadota bacterium]